MSKVMKQIIHCGSAVPARCWLVVLGGLFLGTGLRAVEISGVEAGNVTPFSVDLVWQTSGEAVPGVEVYSDAAGSESLAGEIAVEVSPLRTGDVAVENDAAARARARALGTALGERQLAWIRISGLEPGVSYYVRPLALDEGGNDIGTGEAVALEEIQTAERNAFVAESRQLLLEFGGAEAAEVEGAVVRVSVPGLAVPLFAMVGDVGTGTEAFVNLDHLLEASGTTNLRPTEPLDLDIRLLGTGAPGGTMRYTVPYGGGTVVSDSAMVAFAPNTEGPDRFVFDPIGEQQVGQPFTITLRALDASGDPLTQFAGEVDLDSNRNLSVGGGRIGPFSEGVLSGHTVVVAEPGETTLEADWNGGAAIGSSESFTVTGSSYDLSTNVIPESGGTVSGGGTYAEGTAVTVEAMAAAGFVFDRWTGEGLADYEAAVTTVTLTSDLSITAVFVEEAEVALYDDWKPGAFLRLAGDAGATDPAVDLDGDGLSNLLEYAFGGSPLFADREETHPAIERDSATGQPVFRYRHRPGATDLQVVIEVSESLGSDWVEMVPDPADLSVVDLGDGLQEIRVRMPNPADAPAFYRIRVTQTSP